MYSRISEGFRAADALAEKCCPGSSCDTHAERFDKQDIGCNICGRGKFAFGCNMGCSVIVSQLFGAKDYVTMKSSVYTALSAPEYKNS